MKTTSLKERERRLERDKNQWKPSFETKELSKKPWFVVYYKSKFAKHNLSIQADDMEDAKNRVRMIYPKYEVL